MRIGHVTREARPALIAGGRVRYLDRELGFESIEQIIAGGPDALEQIRGLEDQPRRFVDDPGTRAAPVRRPGTIVCVGLNYVDHAAESDVETPTSPLLFAKWVNSIAGPDEPVSWDPELTKEVDYEVELAAVVGDTLSNVTAERGLEGVFGYTVGNDLSARDLQLGDGQWTRGKSLDGFCPIGPEIVTPDEFGDPQAHGLRTRVNGKTLQDSSTAEMVFGVAEIISFVSRGCTLEPGDLVLTGTPPGVGLFQSPPRFLGPGDEVEVEVDGIGVLRTPIGAWEPGGAEPV